MTSLTNHFMECLDIPSLPRIINVIPYIIVHVYVHIHVHVHTHVHVYVYVHVYLCHDHVCFYQFRQEPWFVETKRNVWHWEEEIRMSDLQYII